MRKRQDRNKLWEYNAVRGYASVQQKKPTAIICRVRANEISALDEQAMQCSAAKTHKHTNLDLGKSNQKTHHGKSYLIE